MEIIKLKTLFFVEYTRIPHYRSCFDLLASAGTEWLGVWWLVAGAAPLPLLNAPKPTLRVNMKIHFLSTASSSSSSSTSSSPSHSLLYLLFAVPVSRSTTTIEGEALGWHRKALHHEIFSSQQCTRLHYCFNLFTKLAVVNVAIEWSLFSSFIGMQCTHIYSTCARTAAPAYHLDLDTHCKPGTFEEVKGEVWLLMINRHQCCVCVLNAKSELIEMRSSIGSIRRS